MFFITVNLKQKARNIADEHFKNNIDRHGNGTAQFMSDGIKAY